MVVVKALSKTIELVMLEEMLLGAVDVSEAVYDAEIGLLKLENRLLIEADIVGPVFNAMIELLALEEMLFSAVDVSEAV